MTGTRDTALDGAILYLSKYNDAIAQGDSVSARRLHREILKLPYPTVLVEMRRQSDKNRELEALFSSIPLTIGARP
jgi:hypothetical protein